MRPLILYNSFQAWCAPDHGRTTHPVHAWSAICSCLINHHRNQLLGLDPLSFTTNTDTTCSFSLLQMVVGNQIYSVRSCLLAAYIRDDGRNLYPIHINSRMAEKWKLPHTMISLPKIDDLLQCIQMTLLTGDFRANKHIRYSPTPEKRIDSPPHGTTQPPNFGWALLNFGTAITNISVANIRGGPDPGYPSGRLHFHHTALTVSSAPCISDSSGTHLQNSFILFFICLLPDLCHFRQWPLHSGSSLGCLVAFP